MAALLLLFRLQRRATIRRIFRTLQSPRGAVFFLVGASMFAIWIGTNLFANMTAGPANLDTTRNVAPLVLLGLWVLNLASLSDDKAIYFSPAEVNFLFAAPFTRRQLLLYRLVTVISSAALTGLFMTVVMLRHTNHSLATFYGAFMALLFIQLFTMISVLIAQTVGSQSFVRVRRVLLIALFLLVVAGVYQTFETGVNLGFESAILQFRGTWAGTILLAPFDIFAQTMTAIHFYDFLRWGALSLVLNLAVILLVLRLDVDFLESSMNQSQRAYDRLQDMRRGGANAWSARKTSNKVRLPQFPRLAGGGPIAWRQFTTATRNSRVFFIVIIIMAVVVSPLLFLHQHGRSQWLFFTPIAWISLFLTARMTFDFRGDLNHMDSLKGLPVSSLAIVLGELATPVCMMTLVHFILLAALVIAGRMSLITVIGIAIFLVPVNVILFEVDNLLFLWFPTRAIASGPADFQFIGRSMLLAIAKFILFGICAGVAGLVGLGGYLIFGKAAAVAAIAAWVMLVVVAGTLIPCLIHAYKKFDLSTETPP